MTTNVKDIVIVGGGSSGWMTAATLASQLENVNIKVIESPNIPTVGVGESTIGSIRAWMRLVGITDKDLITNANASYKLAIKFNDFYKKDYGSWYYPFGTTETHGNIHNREDWFIKKMLYPNTPVKDYVDCLYPQMALVTQNKIDTHNPMLNNFDFYNDTAFHFDATMLGIWLRDIFCKELGVEYICAEVQKISTDNTGIKELELTNNKIVTGDLFVDCTGFKSLLLGETLGVPFNDYSNILPNNRAWATRVQYTDKESQLNSVTDCTAMDNGWIWNIPLWNRVGTGYVYSDEFVTPKNAKSELISHLQQKGYSTTDCEFKDIKIRTGIHEKLWVKNVVAIGLSAAFVEPLESSGLATTYEFATNLTKILVRGNAYTQWDRDEFNLICEDLFNYYAHFVSMHYALSHRDDTEYWRKISETSYVSEFTNLGNLQTQGVYFASIYNKNFIDFLQDDDGINCLAAGMNWNPSNKCVVGKIFPSRVNLHDEFQQMIKNLDYKKEKWNSSIKTAPSLNQYLYNNYFKD